jgi:hypothetical protein
VPARAVPPSQVSIFTFPWRPFHELYRAVTHARHRLLAGALYGWYYVAQDRTTNKQAVAVAVLHWVRRRRAAAFAWWRVWAISERALRLRCEGYSLVRAARTKTWVLIVLRWVISQGWGRGAVRKLSALEPMAECRRGGHVTDASGG